MQVTTKAKYVRSGARKLRLLRALILGKDTEKAVQIMKVTARRGAEPVAKAIRSAVADARQQNAAATAWIIKNLIIDEGPRLKRFRAAPMGRGVMIKRRMSHITVTVEDIPTEGKK